MIGVSNVRLHQRVAAMLAASLCGCGDPGGPGTDNSLEEFVGSWRYAEWRICDESAGCRDLLTTGDAGFLTVLPDSSFRLEEFINTSVRSRSVRTGRVEVQGDVLRFIADVELRQYQIRAFPDDDAMELTRVDRVPDPHGCGSPCDSFDESIRLARVAPLGSREGRIVFVRSRDLGGGSDLWWMPAAGGSPVRLTNDPATEADPAWSPDGQKIAFVSNRDGSAASYVMDLGGTDVIRIDPGFSGASPAWSADGQRIAVVRADGIYIVPATGEPGAIKLGPSSDAEALWRYPAWSPDGASLLTVAQVPAASFSQILEAEVDGSAVRLVVPDAGSLGLRAAVYSDPEWSPGGDSFMFTAGGGFNHGIVHQLVATGARRQITEDGRGASWPAFSPSGGAYAFGSFGDIYLGTLEGAFINLSADPQGSETQPDWGP